MKVVGPNGVSTPTSARATRSTSVFSLGQTAAAAAPPAATASAAAGGVSDVSALMALQGVEGPLERRRRAIRRGGGLLDRLDELKLALLSGDADQASLDRLARSLREERADDGDPGLNAVLDQIDLRASVELAKAEMRGPRG
ncbi:MAG: flagellar assembly protein FliX [Candidatus Brevundimonas colombiensis]|uniref:Flagellar assembly protein FliX n=1 Tax=Candidatus Brevundimonas colombiensis TaxID=3121376 RepID=A0AAJ6BLM3_9CAUL|nr:flagellar assembly protein FliX [Brevundimonas sp.]WEK39711.1 MAG: flagellar assembly protein FliX [Brevundimonas sp.]